MKPIRKLTDSDDIHKLKKKGLLVEFCYCGHLGSDHKEASRGDTWSRIKVPARNAIALNSPGMIGE